LHVKILGLSPVSGLRHSHSVRFKNYLGERINAFSFVLILYFIIFASHKESEIKNIITRNTIWQ